ncbi:MAG TPA: hypothetical protein VEY70_10540 [Metabacillus sp.]|nr:hypothetical protein [Metabacillus sp.]
MITRPQELIDYINLLMRMSDKGILKAEDMIEESIQLLHNLLFPKQEKESIIVFEKDFNGVCNTYETFRNLLGKSDEYQRCGDDIIFTKGNTTITIINLHNTAKDLDTKLRGRTFTYVINNTDDDKLIEKLGLQVETKV